MISCSIKSYIMLYTNIFVFTFISISFTLMTTFNQFPLVYPQEENNYNAWKNFTDLKNGIKLEYPYNWKIENQHDKNIIVLISSPLEVKNDTNSEKMSLGIEKLSSATSLQNFSEMVIKNLDHSLNKFKIIDKTITSLSNQPAYRVLYLHEINNKKFQILQEWTLFNNTSYILSFGTNPSKYLQKIATFNKIANSFEIIGKEKQKKVDNTMLFNKLYNTNYNYTIKIPLNWDVILKDNKLTLVSKIENSSDKYLEKFEVISKKDTINIATEHNVSKRLDILFSNEKSFYNSSLTGFSLLSVNNINTLNHTCIEFTFTFLSNIGNTKGQEMICLNGLTYYIITFTSHNDQFEKNLEIINKIIRSIEFL